jgi:hypothetical protein
LQIVLANPQKDSALFGAAYLALEDIFSLGKVEELIDRLAIDRANPLSQSSTISG